MIFKKYSEIENSYRQKFIDLISEQGLNGGEDWIVTEKIHGSNFQMICDGTEVKTGTRSKILADNENFFNWETIYDKYNKNVSDIFSALKKKNTELAQLTIFGELYGGLYQHDDVPRQQASKIQKGVSYCPHNDYMVFDIYCINKGQVNGIWLPYNEVIDLCTTYGMMCLTILFIGTLEDALKYPNDFQSTIYQYHGLPIIENNTCEGVVIKPNNSKHFYNGSRVIIKNKNEKFAENKSTSKVSRIEVSLSDKGKDHIAAIHLLITENRLKNLLSKIGSITTKDFGKLMSGMMSDILNEYLKDNKETYDMLTKVEQKIVSKEITQSIAELIRPNFVNIIDGNY